MNWSNIWNDIKSFFVNNGWHITGFFAAFIIGLIIVRLSLKIVKRILGSTKLEKIAQHFIYSFIKLGFYLIWVLILLNLIGVEITGIITALSALILTVGLALESNISNLANGIVIVSSHLFKKGDFIEVDGKSGSIVEINFLFTTIMTGDNKRITIPNSSIVNSAVTNFGTNKTRRVDFTFSVAYESDVELVKSIVIKVMESNGKVLLEPKAPFCRLKTLNASSLDFFANCWCDNEDYWDVYYYVVENTYNEFKRNNISVPFNQLEVRNRTDNVKMPVIKAELPKRVEKERIPDNKHSEVELFSKLFIHKSKSEKKKEKKELELKDSSTTTENKNNTPDKEKLSKPDKKALKDKNSLIGKELKSKSKK